MKRRQFLTTAALTAIGASVAPQILKGNQDPYREYERLSEELLEWYVTPREAYRHSPATNYWNRLKGQSEWGYKNAIAESKVYHENINHDLGLHFRNGKGHGITQWNKGGLLRVSHVVSLRDYANVYECRVPLRPTNMGEWSTVGWINVEDYEFYSHWMEGEFPLNTGPRQLMGVELVPGLVDPFSPSASCLRDGSNRGNVRPIIPDRIGVVDSYEIHVMWRKR